MTMRKPTPQQVQTAKNALNMLFDTIKRWQYVNAIRRKLPPTYARRIPPSRAKSLVAILRGLKRAGALKFKGTPSLGDGYGWVQVAIAGVAIVAIAGAAAVWAIFKYLPQIQQEWRLVRQAESAATLAMNAWKMESQETAMLGPEAARERAAARAGESAQLISTVMPTSYPSPGAEMKVGLLDKLGLPPWFPIAGILGGSAILALLIYSKGGRR